MTKRTCGECKHYFRTDRYGFCNEFGGQTCEYREVTPNSYCFEQKVITNGDIIRKMDNTDLAEMLVYPVKPMNVNGNIHYEFTSCLLLGKSYPMREQAVFLTERRLNAPAGEHQEVE